VEPLSGRIGAKQNDNECEADGMGSHVALLSAQSL
jgi:hypothetical protein